MTERSPNSFNWQEFIIFNVASKLSPPSHSSLIHFLRISLPKNHAQTRKRITGLRWKDIKERKHRSFEQEKERRRRPPFIVPRTLGGRVKIKKKKGLIAARDERTMFGRVAGARRRARRGETKGQDLLLVTASPLHLGRRTRVSEAAFNGTRPFALHPRHMAWPTFIIDA